MTNPRTLLITLRVEDEGGPDDYTNLINSLSAFGEIVNEEEEEE